jgi:hypothetical protein
MRYWPTSVIAQNPALHPAAVVELLTVTNAMRLTPHTMAACCEVAGRTPSRDTNLFFIETRGCSFRRMYLDYPDFEDWFRLERGGFVDTEIAGFGYVLDALH